MWEKEKILVKILVTIIFSFFPTTSTVSKTESIIYVTFILPSANAFNLDKVKFLSSGKGLKATRLLYNFHQRLVVLTILMRAVTLAKNKILDWSKFKAFADDKIHVNVNEQLKIWFGKGRKGENAGTSIFSYSHHAFKRLL